MTQNLSTSPLVNWFRKYFGFSRTEANAYLTLILALIIAHFVCARINISLATNPAQIIFLDSLFQTLDTIQSSRVGIDDRTRPFDPNQISYSELVSMGLPPFVSKNLVRYRESGGSYKNATDLKRLYGMNDSIWQILAPLVKVGYQDSIEIDQQSIESSKPERKGYPATLRFDLNIVDTTMLKKIKGIGPVLSKRIIKYREALGGFYSVEQLLEVYHLPPSVVDEIRNYAHLELDEYPLHKLNLNQLDYTSLASHPYISYNLAKTIVAFRDQHGPFLHLEDLKKIHLVDDSTYLRVSPYLDF